MATSTYPTQTGTVDNTSAASFIPEIWSDEIVATYKASLVVANNVKKMNFKGKKGDTVHIPKPTRGSANAKVENQAVTLQNNVESTVDVSISSHYEYTHLIEDITEAQALASLRRFYTEDAGYALATQIDTDLLALGKQFGDDAGTGTDWVHSNSYYVDAANGLAAYAIDTVAATDVFTDLAFREALKELDDNDTPMSNRFFVIPPSARKDMLALDRYVSSDFGASQGVANGMIGNVYGVDIFVSTNVPVVETATANTASAEDVRGAMFAHKDSMILVEQQGIRSQTQYKQEFLATMYTADCLYGVEVLRPESGLVIVLPT
jgi:N4-gp56 family major capsid protein